MINLILPELRSQRQTKAKLTLVATGYIVITVLFGLGAAGLFYLNTTQQAKNESIRQQIDQLNAVKQDQDELSQKAAFIEERIGMADQYKEDIIWTEALSSLAAKTPEGVQLTSTNYNRDQQTIRLSIAGQAVDRRTIVLFQDKLARSELFVNPVIQSIGDGGEGSDSFSFTLSTNLKKGAFDE